MKSCLFETESLSNRECLEYDFNLEPLIELAGQSEHSVFAVSKNAIQRQYQKLRHYLPMVQTHYAIKALPLQEVIESLNELGSSFDIASNGEIDLLKNADIDPSKVIHSHPVKRIVDIEYALNYGITTFVVDNEAELAKFMPYKNKVRLLLRLSFRNSDAKCDLSSKFGLTPEGAVSFILEAKQLGIQIDGLSFHVGSNCINSKKMIEALTTCKQLYVRLEEIGISMSRIDIGGGFPSTSEMSIQDEINYFQPIANYLEQHFSTVQILSEPGRFIAAPSAIVLCKVIGKSIRNGMPCYYLNDGVYNNFSGLIFDHSTYPISAPQLSCSSVDAIYKSILFGPTCDSVDIMSDSIYLPDLAINDVILATQIGAYSLASSSNFNFLGQTIFHFEN